MVLKGPSSAHSSDRCLELLRSSWDRIFTHSDYNEECVLPVHFRIVHCANLLHIVQQNGVNWKKNMIDISVFWKWDCVADTNSFSRCLLWKHLERWTVEWRNLKRHDSHVNFSSMWRCERHCLIDFSRTNYFMTAGVVYCSWFQMF